MKILASLPGLNTLRSRFFPTDKSLGYYLPPLPGLNSLTFALLPIAFRPFRGLKREKPRAFPAPSRGAKPNGDSRGSFLRLIFVPLRIQHQGARQAHHTGTTRTPLALHGRHRADNRMKALAIGGIDDHVHILLSLPSTLAIAKAIQLVKGNSSKWIHETFPKMSKFAWQEGYGAFSIGISQIDSTVAYIQNQQKHHRKKTFQEEFLSILKKHGIEYDPRFVWG
jgi:putative transposase